MNKAKKSFSAKAVIDPVRSDSLKASLAELLNDSKLPQAKHVIGNRDAKAQIICEQLGFSITCSIRWDKVDSADLDKQVRRTHKVNTGTPEQPNWIIVHQKNMYENNERTWEDETGVQYAPTQVHDFTIRINAEGKEEEIETRPFDRTTELRISKLIPTADIYSEFLIEYQYEIYSTDMTASLLKFAQFLKERDSAAVVPNFVLRKGYKNYNALLIPLFRPDNEFTILAFLVRARKKLKHWMSTETTNQPATQSKLINSNAATVSVIEEI